MPIVIRDEEIIGEALKKVALPEPIAEMSWKFGNDHTGDPAIFLSIVVKDKYAEDMSVFPKLWTWEYELAEIVRKTGSDRIPYPEYMTETEANEHDSDEDEEG